MSGTVKRLLLMVWLVCSGFILAGCSVAGLGMESVTVQSREIKSSNEELVLDISYPVVSNLRDRDLESRINTEIQRAVMIEKNDITSLARTAEHWNNAPFDLHYEYVTTFNRNGILSITTTLYRYTGGAHGMTVRRSYNYDLKTGQQMTLKDVFGPETDYKQIINQEIRKQIEQRKQDFFEDEFKSITDRQNFYLEDKNLVIYFDLYEIAPYSTGIPEFRIAYSTLEGVRPELLEK